MTAVVTLEEEKGFQRLEPQVVPLNLRGTHIRVSASFAALRERSVPHWAGLLLFEIKAFGREVNVTPPEVIHLERPLEQDHWGGYRLVEGYELEMAAEVVNLNRTVVITGDHEDFDAARKGGPRGLGAIDVLASSERASDIEPWCRFAHHLGPRGRDGCALHKGGVLWATEPYGQVLPAFPSCWAMC